MSGTRRHRIPQHRCMERTCRYRRAIHSEMKEALYRRISKNSYMGRYKRSQTIQDGDNSRQHYLPKQCE